MYHILDHLQTAFSFVVQDENLRYGNTAKSVHQPSGPDARPLLVQVQYSLFKLTRVFQRVKHRVKEASFHRLSALYLYMVVMCLLCAPQHMRVHHQPHVHISVCSPI